MSDSIAYTADRPRNADTHGLKIPPHSIEAEQSVLGGLMLDNRAWEHIVDRITETDFYRREHRLIWRAITALEAQTQPFDLVTLSEELSFAITFTTLLDLAPAEHELKAK